MQTDLLKRVPLFSDLPETDLKMLASMLQVLEVGPDTVLFRTGDSGDEFYIIIEGQVDVLLALGTADERILATFGPGEYIGEMSLFVPGGSRSANARTTGPARMWVMTRDVFNILLQRQPMLAYQMVRVLSERLTATTRADFHDLQEKNRQLQQAYDDLQAAQAQIIEKERLERELQVAAEIQVSILPQTLPLLPGYDFGACMIPARMVGGDFYDVFLLGSDRVGILIGDVADKGVPSAIFMARAHALITAEAVHGGSPGRVLKRANDHLIKLEQANLFVTVIFGVLDGRTGEFEFARAGHELPLLANLNGEVVTLSHGTGQAIGMLENPVFDENQVKILPGSTLLLFTDGVTDERDPQDEFLGRDGLIQAFAQLVGKNAQAVCDSLLASVKAFQSDSAQDDDITLVAIHSAKRRKK